MKIRSPFLIKLVSFLGSCLIRFWIATLSCKFRIPPAVDVRLGRLPRHYLYLMWHEDMLAPVYHFHQANIGILTSQHADGEIIARVLQYFRVRTVRGSTSRGGSKAMRQLIHASQQGHLGMTPDGPRGPRRQVQIGALFLASRTGMPIVPVGYGYRHAYRLRSWDRFALPLPWSQIACVVGEPIPIPPDLERDQLEMYRLQVEQAFLEVTRRAHDLVNPDQAKLGTSSQPQRGKLGEAA